MAQVLLIGKEGGRERREIKANTIMTPGKPYRTDWRPACLPGGLIGNWLLLRSEGRRGDQTIVLGGGRGNYCHLGGVANLLN